MENARVRMRYDSVRKSDKFAATSIFCFLKSSPSKLTSNNPTAFQYCFDKSFHCPKSCYTFPPQCHTFPIYNCKKIFFVEFMNIQQYCCIYYILKSKYIIYYAQRHQRIIQLFNFDFAYRLAPAFVTINVKLDAQIGESQRISLAIISI